MIRDKSMVKAGNQSIRNMADNNLPRMGGVASIISTILIAIGAALHPNPLPWGTVGTRQFLINAMNAINGFDLWGPIHWILLPFPIVLSFSVTVLYKIFRDRGEEVFSTAALVAVVLATPVHIVAFAIDGSTVPILARAYVSAATEVSREAALISFQNTASIIIPINDFIVPLMLWSSFGFIGAAAIRTRIFPRWVGYLGVALGVAMWVDWPAAVVFIPSYPALIVVAALSGQLFVTVFWIIAVGIHLIRLRPQKSS